VRKMSLRSPPSRRTFAAWQSWLPDHRQYSICVLRDRVGGIGTRQVEPNGKMRAVSKSPDRRRTFEITDFRNKICHVRHFAPQKSSELFRRRTTVKSVNRPADWAVISFRRCSGHDVMKSRCSHTAVLILGDCLASLSRCFCRAILQSKQTTWRFIMLRGRNITLPHLRQGIDTVRPFP
jgi:hypothetical protein